MEGRRVWRLSVAWEFGWLEIRLLQPFDLLIKCPRRVIVLILDKHLSLMLFMTMQKPRVRWTFNEKIDY